MTDCNGIHVPLIDLILWTGPYVVSCVD